MRLGWLLHADSQQPPSPCCCMPVMILYFVRERPSEVRGATGVQHACNRPDCLTSCCCGRWDVSGLPPPPNPLYSIVKGDEGAPNWLRKLEVAKHVLVDEAHRARPDVDALAAGFVYLQVWGCLPVVLCFGCSFVMLGAVMLGACGKCLLGTCGRQNPDACCAAAAAHWCCRGGGPAAAAVGDHGCHRVCGGWRALQAQPPRPPEPADLQVGLKD